MVAPASMEASAASARASCAAAWGSHAVGPALPLSRRATKGRPARASSVWAIFVCPMQVKGECPTEAMAGPATRELEFGTQTGGAPTSNQGRGEMMLASRFTSRAFPIGALAATILLCSVPGHGASKRAKKAKNACAAAHTRAQAREKAGKLREARELFSTCAAAQCGRAIKKDCATRYAQLETEIPSIIPVLVDDPRKDVQVSVDGEILTSRLDGRPLSIDPGAHDLTFSAEGEVFAASRFTIARSERGRRISGDGLESETPAQATRPEPKAKERAPDELSADEAKESAHEAEGDAPA